MSEIHLLKQFRALETAQWDSAMAYNGQIIGSTNGTEFAQWDILSGMELHGNTVNIVSMTERVTGGVCTVVGTGASAYFTSQIAASLQVVDLSTGYYTRRVNGAGGFVWTVAAAQRGKQVCWNSSSNYVGAVCSGANGAISVFNVATGASANSTTLGGANYWSIIPHKTNGNFLLTKKSASANTPSVEEVSWTGAQGTGLAVVQTVTLDMTRNYGGTSVATSLISLSMTPDGSQVIVSDDRGGISLMDWPSGTVRDRVQLCARNSNASTGLMISDLASGYFVATPNFNGNNSSNGAVTGNLFVALLRATEDRLMVLDLVVLPQTAAPYDCGFDETTNTAWVSQVNQWLNLYQFQAPYETLVSTRIQDPPGTDVDGRIIRIRDLGTKSYVTLDTAISAGATSLPAQMGGEYYEIALTGTGSSRKWDWRKFNV